MLTTHYMDEAEVLCDRVAIMDHGRVLELDSPAGLVRGLDAPTRITVAPGQLTLDEAAGLPGVDARAEGADGLVLTTRTRHRGPGRLADATTSTASAVQTGTLEDVFLDLTGREYRA